MTRVQWDVVATYLACAAVLWVFWGQVVTVALSWWGW